MIADLKPYPEYRDSVVPWLGQVPQHWEVRRLGAAVTGCINGTWGSDPNGRDDMICVRVADFDRTRLRVRTDRPTLRAIAPAERHRKQLRKGDLLLEKSGGGDLQPVGVVMLYDHETVAVCSNFVARMPVASGHAPDYLVYLHACLYSIRLNVRSIKQTTGIQNLDSRAYLSEVVAFPPLPEQAAIARFLDHADRRIRRYIRAKQRLIALLNEQKQAIIHRAVTRGLDPNVRLKPSGVEWLGDVPQHWGILRQRNAVEMRVSNIDKHTKEGELPVRLCNYVDVYKNDHITERVSFMRATATPEEIERFRLEPGDVLITKDSETWNDIGVPALVEYTASDLVCGYHLAMLRPRKGLMDGAYLLRALQSPAVAYQYHVSANGVTRYGLSHDAIKSVLVPVPPLAEQSAIARFLDDATADLDRAISVARRETDLIREYRTRLIADVVTGKLDVREAARHLPDEVEEPEMLDEALSEDNGEVIADGESIEDADDEK